MFSDRVNEEIKEYAAEGEMDERTFESLDIWKESRGFRNQIKELSSKFPEEEQYRLVDEMIRSSRSITANIAEGYGCYYPKENIRYCRKARGSIMETLDHLYVAIDEGYIKQETFDELRNDILQLRQLLNGYIRYLKKQQKQTNDS